MSKGGWLLLIFFVTSLIDSSSGQLPESKKGNGPNFKVLLQKKIKDSYNQTIYNVTVSDEDDPSQEATRDIVKWFLSQNSIVSFSKEIDAPSFNQQQNLASYIRTKKEIGSGSEEMLLHESILSDGAKVLQSVMPRRKKDAESKTPLPKERSLLGRLHEVNQSWKNKDSTAVSDTPSTETSVITSPYSTSTDEIITQEHFEENDETFTSTNYEIKLFARTSEPSTSSTSPKTAETTNSTQKILTSKQSDETGGEITPTKAPPERDHATPRVSEVKKVPIQHTSYSLTIAMATMICVGIVLVVLGILSLVVQRTSREPDPEFAPDHPEMVNYGRSFKTQQDHDSI